MTANSVVRQWDREPPLMRRSHVALIVGIGTVALGATWGTISTMDERRARSELEAAKKEMSAGRFSLARNRLTDLVARRPSWGDALYQLGVCEQARNRP